MEPWYNVFSYWGLVLFLLSPWLPFPVLSVLLFNLIWTLAFVPQDPKLATFLVVVHTVPVVVLRHQPITIGPLVGSLVAYFTVLSIQGLSLSDVYPPPNNLRDYLRLRLGDPGLLGHLVPGPLLGCGPLVPGPLTGSS